MELGNSRAELTKYPAVSREEVTSQEVEKGYGLGMRHVQGLLIFLCFFTIFVLRINLSVGIVAMTNKNSSNADFHEFDWSEKEKSAVLSSFFWGYLVMQAPAGFLGQLYSPKRLLLYSSLLSALLALLTPSAALSGGWRLLCAVRVLQGLSQGFAVPLTYNLVSKWAPPNERNRFVGFSLNGATLGATVGLPLCGILASSQGGWPSIFYLSGLLGLLWSLLWAWLAADSPALHTTISLQEKTYILNSLQQISEPTKLKVPWKAIFTSVPFWAVVVAQLGFGWGFSITLTEMPSYIDSILKFNIKTNGLLSALPYLSMWILTFPVCWLADYLQKNKILSVNVIRKLWTTISQTGGASSLVVMCLVGAQPALAIILLTIAISLSSFVFNGFNMNHLDLAPNFAGVLMGIGNGLENISTIIAPLSVGWIISDTTSVEQWRVVFIVSACISITSNIVFVIFGSTETQSWNFPKTEEIKKDNSAL